MLRIGGKTQWWAGLLASEADCTARREAFLVDGKQDILSRTIGRTTVMGRPAGNQRETEG